MTTDLRIALVGNPNCGKTSLFNHLTGTRQKVANYAGVTVEKKLGILHFPHPIKYEYLIFLVHIVYLQQAQMKQLLVMFATVLQKRHNKMLSFVS